VDTEPEAYDGMLVLDCGFYGNSSEYMWTLAYDVYNPAISTIMHTYQVGQMNTGEVNLGEHLAYKIIYADNNINVFTTQQMYRYNYKAVKDVSNTMLVYGWQYLDHAVPDRGTTQFLLAPTTQASAEAITELRIFSQTLDRRYTLPSPCVGATVQGKNLYAFSPEYLYRADIDSQRFYGYALPLPGGVRADGFIGLTGNGRALLTCGDTVYSVGLPK
jgi:hypothetical protein